MTLATRRKCWTKGCVEYFTPTSAAQTYCIPCMTAAVDKALPNVFQDNREPQPFLTPISAQERAQIQIHNAQLTTKVIHQQALLDMLHSVLSSIATPRFLPTDS